MNEIREDGEATRADTGRTADQANGNHASKDLRSSAAALWGVVGILVPGAGWYGVGRAMIVGIRMLRLPRPRIAAGLIGLLMALIGLVCQLGYLSLAVQSVCCAREYQSVGFCKSRLGGLIKSMGIYHAGNRDTFPCMSDPTGKPPARFDDEPQMHENIDDFWANEYDCNLQALWLLVLSGEAGENLFECPGDEDYRKPDHSNYGLGFDSWRNSSYAFQPLTHHEDNKAYPQIDGRDPNMVIVGDKQIGGGLGTLNHRRGNFGRLAFDMIEHAPPTNMVGWQGNHAYLKDVSPEGQLHVSPEQVRSSSALEGLESGVFADHPNDSVLFWRDDADKTSSVVTEWTYTPPTAWQRARAEFSEWIEARRPVLELILQVTVLLGTPVAVLLLVILGRRERKRAE